MTAKEFIHRRSGLVVKLERDLSSGGFFATVPALPGCGSQGDTENETLANANDALGAVLDLLKDEEPRRYEQIVGTLTCGGGMAASEPDSTGGKVEIVEGRAP